MTYRQYTHEELAAVFDLPSVQSLPSEQEILDCAIELHKFYRAASKVLCGFQHHDHGWAHCHKQKYFIKRAKQFLLAPEKNAETSRVPF